MGPKDGAMGALERLKAALDAEHCDACHDERTCDINVARRMGLYLYAGHLLANATDEGVDETTAALEALAPSQEDIDAEGDELCAVPHITCDACNAVNWRGVAERPCGACGAALPRPTLDEFTAAYVACALWSSTDESDDSGGRPMDDTYGADDIAPETLARMVADCADFQRDNAADGVSIAGRATCAGHDFWLTRNDHGAGFWDGDWPDDAGERLTKASKPYGSFDLYIGDDGQVHGS
jgi:hypothetical protein